MLGIFLSVNFLRACGSSFVISTPDLYVLRYYRWCWKTLPLSVSLSLCVFPQYMLIKGK